MALKDIVNALLYQQIENKTPVSYAPRSMTSGLFAASNTDQRALLNQMAAVPMLFTCVDLVSDATSEVSWHLYRKSRDQRRVYGPQDDRRQEVISHAALDVLNRPNKFMTREELFKVTQQHIDLVGESYWVLASDADFPKAGPLQIWPVRPDRIDPIPHPTEFLSGYLYTDADGHKKELTPEQVVCIRNPDPRDPYRGLGPVQGLLRDLDSERFSAEWNRQFFINSAQPGGIVQVDEGLSDEEFETLRMRWQEQHQGVGNAHRVAILDHGKWVPNAFTQKDMQFAELRHVNQEVIRTTFRVHSHMVGQAESVNRSNAEAAEYTFAKRTVKPRLERIKQALNNDFLPLFGDSTKGLEFDFESPVTEDREAVARELQSKASAVKMFVESGFEPAQVLETVGLPPMDHTPRPQVAPQPSPAELEADVTNEEVTNHADSRELPRANGRERGGVSLLELNSRK